MVGGRRQVGGRQPQYFGRAQVPPCRDFLTGQRRPNLHRNVFVFFILSVELRAEQRVLHLGLVRRPFFPLSEITENIITFQQRRFRNRSKRRFEGLNKLQTVHESDSSDMQRNIEKSRAERDTMHAAGRRRATRLTLTTSLEI